MELNKTYPVFVYGSLLPGLCNHSPYLGGKTLKELPGTVKGCMFDIGGYPIINTQAEGTIEGYVMYIWENMYQSTLLDLDILEGYSENPGKMGNLYEREVVVATTEGGVEHECYVYSMGPYVKEWGEDLVKVKDGDWMEHARQDGLLRLFKSDGAVITHGASDAISNEGAHELLVRHYCGDWGEAHPDDKVLNDLGIDGGDSLMSVFTVDGVKIWVYTEWDRSITTILLPSEW